MSNLKIDAEKITAENKKYESYYLEKSEVEKQSVELTQKILSGEGIFENIPLTERKMLIGLSGLLAEINQMIINPFDYSGEEGNKLKRYQIRYAAVSAAAAIIKAEERLHVDGELQLADLLVMKFLDSINLMEKLDQDLNLIEQILVGKDLKNLFKDLEKISQSFVRTEAQFLKMNIDKIFENSEIQKLYGDDGIEGLEFDLGIFEYLNHKAVEYLFSEEVFNKIINIISSLSSLIGIYEKIRISLKEICSEKE